MDFANVECAIVTFSDVQCVNKVVQGLMKEEFSEEFAYAGSTSFLNWKVSNKYFDADLTLCCCNSKEFSEKFKDLKSLEAVVFLSDFKDSSRFTEVEKTSSCFQEREPEVRLLWDASETIVSDEKREELFTWCIDHQFELVESNENEDEDDIDEGFCTKYGVDRIVEALNAHVWRNHRLKGAQQHDASTAAVDGSTATVDGTASNANCCFEGGESFEELFGKLHLMKEKADTLESDARKDYAEKVAMAFMGAMGIDDDDDNHDNH